MNVQALWLLGLLAYGAPDVDASARLTQYPRAVTAKLSPSEEAWVKANPVVRWGLDPHWPPFSYTDDRGQLVGIDVELTRLAAERAGLRLNWVPTSSWTEALERAQSGEIDLLSATAKTTERSSNFEYSNEYASFPVVIVTRKDGPFFTSLHALRTARIATARDHVTSEKLKADFPDINLLFTRTSEEALLMVSTGKADASIANLAVAGYLISVRGLANLKISGVTGYEFPLRFAVRKEIPLLTSILNNGLETITAQEQNILYAKYLHPELARGRDWGVWRTRALYAVVTGATMLTVVLLWNRTITRQVSYCRTVESALREARDKLEQRTQELDRRVRDVERLNQELTIANKDLDSFSSSVSHDLRAPLRRFNCFNALLQKQLADSTNPDVHQYCKIMDQEAGRMCQLIDDLLAFARIGRTAMRQIPVDMEQLAKEVVREFALETCGRDIHWHVDSLPSVPGDPHLLRQVFVNLIDNAVKFTRKRERAEITIHSPPTTSKDAQVNFCVRDNGCGFDMKHSTGLFTAFRRLHTDAEYEGTGIGLVNVQRIIQRHGGRVWVESAVDRGTTFWFSLPKAPT